MTNGQNRQRTLDRQVSRLIADNWSDFTVHHSSPGEFAVSGVGTILIDPTPAGGKATAVPDRGQPMGWDFASRSELIDALSRAFARLERHAG